MGLVCSAWALWFNEWDITEGEKPKREREGGADMIKQRGREGRGVDQEDAERQGERDCVEERVGEEKEDRRQECALI